MAANRSGLGVWLALAGLAGAAVAAADQHQKVQRVPAELRGPLAYLPLQYSAATLPLVRTLARTLPAARVPGVATRGRTIPGPDGAPELRVLLSERPDRPKNSPALLWIHGGGFVTGAAGTGVDEAPRIARAVNALVVSVDYRLAPEHPFPAALDDCHAALAWLHAHAADLGVGPARIGVGGESAGAGLAACLAQRAQDAGGPPIAFQSLLYPMLDDRTTLREPAAGVGELLWTPPSNRFGWVSYLGAEPGTAAPEYAVAARRADLTGLPPAWIAVGDRDLFHDECVDYAGRLRAAGVEVALEVVEGFYHGADRVAPTAPATRDLLEHQAEALRRGLGLTTS